MLGPFPKRPTVEGMRVGLIGAGRIGEHHAGTLAGLDRVTELLITDVAVDRAAATAAAVGAGIAASLDELLRRVDALVVAAPTDQHAELILAGVGAGLPVFCEKPLALDLARTGKVVAAAAAAGVAVQMGFQRRFDAGFAEAARLVSTGELGDLYLVRASTHDPEPPPPHYVARSGGIFRDMLVHDFDALRFVTGQEVDEVYADGSVRAFEQFAEHDDVDTAAVTLRFSGGTLGVVLGARHDPRGYDIRLEVFGSGDSVAVGWDDRTPLRSIEPGAPPLPGPAYRFFQDRFAAAYRAELAAFIEVAAGERPSPCTVVDAEWALRIAEACELSRRQHRPVMLTEVPPQRP